MSKKDKYATVNSVWPEGTNDGRNLKPTPKEALAAAKRLYRFALKRPFKGPVKLVSGRRYTWVRNGVLYVNPDYRGGGWHELVHLLSHYCAYRLHPGAKAHGPQHAFAEREMIRYVLTKGWLDGKLKRPEKPEQDPQRRRAEKVVQDINRWERKAKLAATKLKKLRAQRQRYVKLGVIPSNP